MHLHYVLMNLFLRKPARCWKYHLVKHFTSYLHYIILYLSKYCRRFAWKIEVGSIYFLCSAMICNVWVDSLWTCVICWLLCSSCIEWGDKNYSCSYSYLGQLMFNPPCSKYWYIGTSLNQYNDHIFAFIVKRAFIQLTCLV